MENWKEVLYAGLAGLLALSMAGWANEGDSQTRQNSDNKIIKIDSSNFTEVIILATYNTEWIEANAGYEVDQKFG